MLMFAFLMMVYCCYQQKFRVKVNRDTWFCKVLCKKKKNRWVNFSIAPFPPVWGSNCDFCLVKQQHVIYSLKPVCFISLLEVLGIIFTGCQSLFLSVIYSRINVKGSQSRSILFPGEHKLLRVWVPALLNFYIP